MDHFSRLCVVKLFLLFIEKIEYKLKRGQVTLWLTTLTTLWLTTDLFIWFNPNQ